MEFAPGSLSPAPVTLSSDHPITQSPARPLPAAAWRTHLLSDARLTALPDGTPLQLTASGIDLFERLTGGSYIPQDFHESTILLWCATRTPEELEAVWIPAPPESTEPEDPAASIIPIYNIPSLMRRVVRWRDGIIPAGARLEVHRLALALWDHEHGTLLEVDEAGLPDVPEAEKKSPPAVPTGSSPPSMPSPEATPADGLTCSTASAIAPSSPLTAHGSLPTESPSSLPPSDKSGTDSSTSCLPSPLTPVDPDNGQPFWVAELIGRHPLLYATGHQNESGCDIITANIHEARHFHSADECHAWIRTSNRREAWVARDHICEDAPAAAS